MYFIIKSIDNLKFYPHTLNNDRSEDERIKILNMMFEAVKENYSIKRFVTVI